jgi:acyl carrier protein
VSTEQIDARVKQIWCDVLKTGSVRAESNFFHEGGDSMDAIVFIQALEDELAVTVSVEALFRDASYAAVLHVVSSQV